SEQMSRVRPQPIIIHVPPGNASTQQGPSFAIDTPSWSHRDRMPNIKFTLNGRETEAPYEPGMHLLEVLREECGVVSAKNGCAPEGACGCCLVVIDGRPALSCLRKPEQMAGHDITTLEGLPQETRRVISEAFVLEGGVQCGFCIPGIVMRTSHLIQQGKTD